MKVYIVITDDDDTNMPLPRVVGVFITEEAAFEAIKVVAARELRMIAKGIDHVWYVDSDNQSWHLFECEVQGVPV